MAQVPSEEYLARLRARRASRARLDDADARLAHARLATVFAIVLGAVLVWRLDLSYWWLLPPAAIFVWLVRRHDQVIRARDATIRAIAFYERGLDRLEDRWVGAGEPGERFRDDQHVYANDLDLFGRGSLFELLSLARTRSGEATLARWLMSPADPPEIRGRQNAIAELGPWLDLREALALAGADVRASVHTDRLLAWAEAALPSRSGLTRITWLLTAATVASIAYLALTSTWWPLAVLVGVEGLVLRYVRDQISASLSANDPEATASVIADALAHRVRDLDAVSDLLKHLEGRSFTCARLAQLRAQLTSDGQPASRIIRRLHRLAEAHDSERNAALIPIGMFLFGAYTARAEYFALALIFGAVLQLVRPHVALAVDRWRRRHGAAVRAWVETIGEFEAFSSLSCYHYEHGDDPFPEILDSGGLAPVPGIFEGIQLGHPLIPRATMVRNDVSLTGGTQMLVISGSNMSGKSTLLRTVGINAVLALAGAPVRAATLRLSPLALGATLRIQDSLQEGRSRFYAEITRMRELSDIAGGPVPLLFLLDEIFHGTNSHDRLIGSSGVLRSFLDRGAIGLITTHDLALTAVADELGARARNVHFEDWFEDNDIRFDYRMKTGPVARSNAIALMRAVGLDVPLASSS